MNSADPPEYPPENPPEDPPDRLYLAGFSDVLVEVFFVINYSKSIVNAHFGKNSVMGEYICLRYSFDNLGVEKNTSDKKLLIEQIFSKMEERLVLIKCFTKEHIKQQNQDNID